MADFHFFKIVQMVPNRATHHIWLTTLKTSLKIRNRSQRYDINWPRPRHGHKYTKHKMCLSMMVTYIKQHLLQHLKLDSWKSEATLRLNQKKALLIKKRVCDCICEWKVKLYDIASLQYCNLGVIKSNNWLKRVVNITT